MGSSDDPTPGEPVAAVPTSGSVESGGPSRDLALELARARARAVLFPDAVVEDDASPTRIGRFSVVRRLGSGGMGVVYAGQDEILGRRVAIKLISPERSRAPRARGRMLREAQALARLSHPNVVSVFEAGTHDGLVYLAMEYVEGRTLRQYASEVRPDWRALVSAYVQAGRGLCAAHDAGLVHRDFKPDNAMLGDDGRVRVLDFGLVAAGTAIDSADADTLDGSDDGDDRLTRTGTMVGTPAYMAPEQHLQRSVDTRADQFAFCVSLHEAVFGLRPFKGDTMAALALAVIEGRIEVPERREPRWLYRLIRRGLASDPAQRHPDMHALVRGLERGLGRRRGIWVAVAAATFVSLSLVAGVRVLSSDDPPTTASAADIAAPPVARQVTRLSSDVQITSVVLSRDGAAVAYWAERNAQEWLSVVPSRGGIGASTPRGSIRSAVGALSFAENGDALSLQRAEGGGIDLVATAADGSQRRVRRLPELPPTRGPASARIVGIAPNGRTIATVDAIRDRVVTVDEDGRTSTLAPTGGHVVQIVWSPDGERIAWVARGRRSASRMYISAADGSVHGELRNGAELVRSPCGTLTFAGNDRIAFATYETERDLGVSRLWESQLDEARVAFVGEPQLLQDATPGTPCWLSASADGRQLAFVRFDQRDNISVAAIESDGSLGGVRPLSTDTANEHIAGWTPDGKGVVFQSQRGGEAAYYRRDLDAETLQPLSMALRGPSFALGRDGDRLIFAAGSDALSVDGKGNATELGTFDEIGVAELASCSAGRCTQAVVDGDLVVIRELPWDGAAQRELARLQLRDIRSIAWAMGPEGRDGALAAGDALYIVSLADGSTNRFPFPPREGSEAPLLQYAAWAPDGSALYASGMYIDGSAYALVRMERDGRHTVVHREANRWIHRPHVAPDGRHIAFATWDFEGAIWLIER